MRLHNTLTRREEEVRTLVPGQVRMHSCVPTVYRYAHIGNLRTYLVADVPCRVLEHLGHDVVQVIDGRGGTRPGGQLPDGAASLLEQRAGAREARDFATSDRLRAELAALGVRVIDTRDGQRWEPALAVPPRGAAAQAAAVRSRLTAADRA